MRMAKERVFSCLFNWPELVDVEESILGEEYSLDKYLELITGTCPGNGE